MGLPVSPLRKGLGLRGRAPDIMLKELFVNTETNLVKRINSIVKQYN